MSLSARCGGLVIVAGDTVFPVGRAALVLHLDTVPVVHGTVFDFPDLGGLRRRRIEDDGTV